jgi:baculoviral IAP repeat-containing protein 6
MSIQALILVPDPFFNEPGYEQERGTPSGDRRSTAYNLPLRESTLKHAMIGMLKQPPPELADVIRDHFRLKRSLIAAQTAQWLREARESTGGAGHLATLTRLVDELDVELDKIC